MQAIPAIHFPQDIEKSSFSAGPSWFIDLRATSDQRQASGTTKLCDLRIACELLVLKLLSDFSNLLKVNIANALGEQKCKDVASEFRVIEVAAQDVAGFITGVVKFRLS